MAKKELIDIFDGTGKHIGTKRRDLVHVDGDWHKTFHCWVIYKDSNGVDYVVLQRRSDNKPSWPGYVDITAAGHYLAGEQLIDGLRELKEEVGIEASFDDLIQLGMRVCVEEFQSGSINHEFQDVVFLINDSELDSYNLQGDELSGIMKVPVDDLLKMFNKEIEIINAQGIQLQKDGGVLNKVKTEFNITEEMFIPTLDNYNYKIMILAKRALKKEKHLLI